METVVLLFTDVEGSTRAWATSPGMVRSLERHDAMLRIALASHGGIEFKHTGDGLCATFPSVADAALAAIDAQRALDAADWEDGPALRVRVAIHAGSAHRRGDDWFGLSLSRCARLMGVAHGGQVLVSRAAGVLLAEAPAEGAALADLGHVSLRDFPEPDQVWQVAADGLQVDFPPLRTAPAAGNLPADLSPIIGRIEAIAQVCAAVPQSRLVTLTGAGGVGKTRLALAAARVLAPEFVDGVWLVELASAQESEEVDLLVAATIAVRPRSGSSVRASIEEAIGGGKLLLVLDNCEHMLDVVAELSADLLQRCESLAILATSREPIAVAGERTIGVPSLVIDTEAVELFLARADAAVPGFVGDERVIGEICRRLDGIPLAIELAAAAVRTLQPADIANRLQDHVDVLTAGRRGRIERHATVRAAIDWSWSSLSDEERRALARLSVFAGRFDLAAAAAVTGHTDPVEVLAALVEKSMVVADPRGVAPFRLLEPLRQFAAEQLAVEGAGDQTARRHAEHYAAFAARLAPQLESSDELSAVLELDNARDNFRAAFAYATSQRDGDLCVRLVAPLSEYASTHVWAEAWSWADAALEIIGPEAHPLKVQTLLLASRGAWQRGDQSRALALADQGVALVVGGSEEWRHVQEHRAGALLFLGRFEEGAATAAVALGDPPRLESHGDVRRLATYLLMQNLVHGPDVAAALDLLAHARNRSLTTHALALHVVGLSIAPTDPSAAVEYQRAAADLSATVGSALVHGFALVALAAAEVEADPVESVRRYAGVMSHYLGVGNRVHLREFARGSVISLAGCEAWPAAATVEGATRSSAIFETTLGEPLHEAIRRGREAIGEDYEVCAQQGAAMTDEELVAYMSEVAARL